MQRILICGDRNWINYQLIVDTLSEEHQRENVECVIEGEATGADIMGRNAAEQLGIPVLPFFADWRKYGRSAGPIRNRRQLEAKPTLILAFHDFIDKSKGTKDMVSIALKAGIPTKIITQREYATKRP